MKDTKSSVLSECGQKALKTKASLLFFYRETHIMATPSSISCLEKSMDGVKSVGRSPWGREHWTRLKFIH